jgi:hypothetical protein
MQLYVLEWGRERKATTHRAETPRLSESPLRYQSQTVIHRAAGEQLRRRLEAKAVVQPAQSDTPTRFETKSRTRIIQKQQCTV